MISYVTVGLITAPAEKKQLVVVSAAYSVLVKMVQRNEVAPEVMQKIAVLVECLCGRNFAGANQVQTVCSHQQSSSPYSSTIIITILINNHHHHTHQQSSSPYSSTIITTTLTRT